MVATVSVVVAVSSTASSVWALGQVATETAGAPLAVISVFSLQRFGGPAAAVAGAGVAQIAFMVLQDRAAAGDGMPFVLAFGAGCGAYGAVLLVYNGSFPKCCCLGAET